MIRAKQLYPQRRRATIADGVRNYDSIAIGREAILPDGRRQLDALTEQIRGKYKRLDTITVIGHADRLGNDGYNQSLSIARAATVRNYLAAQGLPQASLRAFGAGRTQPVVQCANSLTRNELITCLQPNRRVELEVTGER